MRASWRKEMLLLMIIMVFVAVDVADDGDVVCENVDGVAGNEVIVVVKGGGVVVG